MGLPVAARCLASNSRVWANSPAGISTGRVATDLASGLSEAAGSDAAKEHTALICRSSQGPTC